MFGAFAAAAALIGAAITAVGQHNTNQKNKGEAQKNRDFQMNASNTAHQREVADLRAAGLNPILSAGGSGASTPSGGQATMENQFEALGSAVADAPSKYMQTKNAQADLGIKHGQLDVQSAQVENLNAQSIAAKAASAKDAMATQVMKKDLPVSEMRNKAFDVVRPYLDRVSEIGQSAARRDNVKPSPQNKALFERANKIRLHQR